MLSCTTPKVQLCPHMLLSWKSLHPQWELCMGPITGRPLDRGRVVCNAVSLHGGPGCYCMLHIRPEADDDLPRVTIVFCPLGENLVGACPVGRLGSIGTQKLLHFKVRKNLNGASKSIYGLNTSLFIRK